MIGSLALLVATGQIRVSLDTNGITVRNLFRRTTPYPFTDLEDIQLADDRKSIVLHLADGQQIPLRTPSSQLGAPNRGVTVAYSAMRQAAGPQASTF